MGKQFKQFRSMDLSAVAPYYVMAFLPAPFTIEFGFPLQDKQLENRIRREDQRGKERNRQNQNQQNTITTHKPPRNPTNKQEMLITRSQGSK